MTVTAILSQTHFASTLCPVTFPQTFFHGLTNTVCPFKVPQICLTIVPKTNSILLTDLTLFPPLSMNAVPITN